MKRLLSLLLALGALTCSAQFPHNGGFEDSVQVSGGYIPADWTVDGFGFGYTNDAHSGSKAASIWNWYYYSRGWIVNGVTQSGFSGGGMPVISNPSVLNGWYKYVYGDNQGAADSAVVEVLVSNAAFDTLAWSVLHLGPTATYEPFSMPIQYRVFGETADTAMVRFKSSINGFCSNASNGTCLYLTVDDLQMESILGTTSIDFEPEVSLAPNPSRSGFRIVEQGALTYPCTLEMRDLLGREVFMQTFESPPSADIHPPLPAGQYAWRIQAADGKTYSGKHRMD